MDNQAILNRLALVGDTKQRTMLLETLCAEDPEKMKRVISLMNSHLSGKSSIPLQHDGFTLDAAEFPSYPDNTDGLDLAVPKVKSLVGESLGNYQILQTLGEGGMGVVYLAQQEHPVKRQVALKVTKSGFISQELIARFQVERQALALMDHENIAKVFDAGATRDGRLYYVMELVRGVAVTAYCDQHQLDTTARLAIFIRICNAIQHAHQKGVVHRDIKPSNVLVLDSDSQHNPKVIDFGLAKALEEQLSTQTLHTQQGQVLGTLEYMSPEQASFSSEGVDTRTDVYSLGVLLYELLTGTTPLGRERMLQMPFDEVLKAIREEEPSKPSVKLVDFAGKQREISNLRSSEFRHLREQFRGDLDSIVLKALEKDRTRRYDSAAALAADIQRFLNNEPVSARPPSAAYLLSKFAKRNRAVVVGLAAVMTALAVGIGFSTYFAFSAQKAAALAERQSKNAQKQRDLALSTLQDVVFQIQVPLAKIPAARDVRQDMLNHAISGLKRMAEEFEDDWTSGRVMMIALEDLGDVFLELGPNADEALEMDHREFAKQQFLRAKQIADRHIDEWADDSGVMYDSAMVSSRLATVEASLGNAKVATSHAIVCVKLLGELAKRDAKRYAGAEFNHCFMLSGMCFHAQDLEQALYWTKQAISIAEDVKRRDVELVEPIYEPMVDELKTREQVFSLLPQVCEDESVAMQQPAVIKHRLLIDRAKHFIVAGDHLEAARTMDMVMSFKDLSPGDCYNSVCRFAACASLLLGERAPMDLDAKEAARYEEFCQKSVELLYRARKAGYFSEGYAPLSLLNSDRDLDPLRERADFQDFVADTRKLAEE